MVNKIIFKKHANAFEGDQIVFSVCVGAGLHKEQNIDQKAEVRGKTDTSQKNSFPAIMEHITPPSTGRTGGMLLF